MSEEIKDLLNTETMLEEQIEANDSPLNAPVIEKDIAGGIANPEAQAAQPGDAPEQPIGQQTQEEQKPPFELPANEAKMAADSILGVASHVLKLGGGFLIKLRKHKEYYDFEEVIQLIDEANERNVKRLALDEEDKALIRPLLIEVLKKRATRLTPEHQLIAVLLSIMMKKAQAVMEIRQENDILTERILDAIREEKAEHQETARQEEVQASSQESGSLNSDREPQGDQNVYRPVSKSSEAPAHAEAGSTEGDPDTSFMLPADLVDAWQEEQGASFPGASDS